MKQRQKGATVVPAGVVGKVGANKTISKCQFLIYRHARHLYNHSAVIPAMDWARQKHRTCQNMSKNNVVKDKV